MSEPAASDGGFVRSLDPLTLEDVVRYAGAAGDFNPMHFDRQLAQRGGFRANFAQGMLLAGLLGVIVGERYGPDSVRALDVRFVSPLWVDEAPSVRGEPVPVQVPAGGEPIEAGLTAIELEMAVDERVVMRGSASVAGQTGGTG